MCGPTRRVRVSATPSRRAPATNLTGWWRARQPVMDTAGAVAGAGASDAAEAVAAAVAKQVDATITPVLATLQQIVQALATATTAIGNIVNQAQPKSS